MKHGLKGLCGAGALVLPLSVMVSIISYSALAQQPSNPQFGGIYGQTTTSSDVGGSLQLFNQVESHSRELRELRGQIEELRYQLEQLKQQSRQQYIDLDSRLTALPAQASAANSAAQQVSGASENDAVADDSADDDSSSSTVDQSTASQSTAGQSSADQSTSARPISSEARDAYQAAFNKVQARDFEQAINEFDVFVERYPDSPLTANAWYWLGELHAAQSSLADATAAFEKVLSDFPQSAKVPDAMYKLGVIKVRDGDDEAGLTLLRSIKDEYPDSNAAALADQYLRQSGA